MCLGKAPGCGVHSLLGGRHIPARGKVHGQSWYLRGCHACDALADEYGPPCTCTPAIAGISDGPSVDCLAHGTRTNQEVRNEEER